MVCSLSSSCLSEIWGGGWETKSTKYVSNVEHSCCIDKGSSIETVYLTASASPGSYHTWMYGWFRASSTEMRHSGSMTSILDSKSRAWPAVMATEEGQCYHGKEWLMTSLHFGNLHENWLRPLTVLGNIYLNVKLCSLVSVMWSLTLNVTDQATETFDLHDDPQDWVNKRFSF